MRNSKATTDQTNELLIEAILVVRSEVSFEAVNILDEAIRLADKVKAQGSFSYRSLKTLSDNMFLASSVLRSAERELLTAYENV